jgi:hypothetical protein
MGLSAFYPTAQCQTMAQSQLLFQDPKVLEAGARALCIGEAISTIVRLVQRDVWAHAYTCAVGSDDMMVWLGARVNVATR